MQIWRHFKTITYHKYLVLKGCFAVGLYRQGLLHDLSKYAPSEFLIGIKYYQGNRSPNNAEREATGYSTAWLHHKGRNKHHFEYWTDFSDDRKILVEMPAKYFAEMVCDRVAASKIYLKEKYTDASPLEYYLNRTDGKSMHPDTAQRLEYFLTLLKEKGEDYTFKQLKKFVKENK